MGGTLSPFASLSRFVRCLSPSQYLFFSADSVAAKERVLALAVPRRKHIPADSSLRLFLFSRVLLKLRIMAPQMRSKVPYS